MPPSYPHPYDDDEGPLPAIPPDYAYDGWDAWDAPDPWNTQQFVQQVTPAPMPVPMSRPLPVPTPPPFAPFAPSRPSGRPVGFDRANPASVYTNMTAHSRPLSVERVPHSRPIPHNPRPVTTASGEPPAWLERWQRDLGVERAPDSGPLDMLDAIRVVGVPTAYATYATYEAAEPVGTVGTFGQAASASQALRQNSGLGGQSSPQARRRAENLFTDRIAYLRTRARRRLAIGALLLFAVGVWVGVALSHGLAALAFAGH